MTDRRGAFAARGFAPLWFSGLCWHWGRWAIAFLASYHVNQMTGSPRMVQLTGAVMWAPLLLGGAIGGVISDRFDRRRTVRLQTALLVPFVAVVGFAERSDQLGIRLLFPFLLFAGVGNFLAGHLVPARIICSIGGRQALWRSMIARACSRYCSSRSDLRNCRR